MHDVRFGKKGCRSGLGWGQVLGLILVLAPAGAGALEISGRVSSDVVSYGERISTLNNNNASFKFFATIIPTRAVDAAIIADVEKRTYFRARGLMSYRYRSLYLRYRAGRLELYAGRQYLSEAIGTGLDGLKVRVALRRMFHVGLWGGIKADPYQPGFLEDYTIFGALVSVNRRRYDASVSFGTEYHRGRFNRGYLVVQSNVRILPNLRFFENATIDTDQRLRPAFVTYADAGAYYSLRRMFDLSLSYSRYRAYREYAFLERSYYVSFYPTHRYTARSRVAVGRGFAVEGSRGLSIRTLDGARTHFFSLALRAERIYPGLRGSVSWYRSWGQIYGNEVFTVSTSYLLGGGGSVRGALSYQRNSTVFAGAERAGLGGRLSFYRSLWQRLTLGLTYSYNSSAGPTQNGLYSHLGYRF